MGKIIDLLTAFIPDIKLTVNVNNKIDNRKVIIKESEIIFGDQTINNPEALEQIHNLIKDHKDDEKLPFQLIEESLLEDYVDYENISIKEKESLSILKKVLSYEDLECILMARRVVMASEKNDVWKDLLDQLDKNYPKKGRKIYLLISANYFDEVIIPFIEVFKAEEGEEKYAEAFRKFYGNILSFFPLAIFVNNHTDKDKIKEEIIKRLKLDVPFFRIHTIGSSNIKKVEEATTELEIEKSYNVTNNIKFMGSTSQKAQIYEIRLK